MTSSQYLLVILLTRASLKLSDAGWCLAHVRVSGRNRGFLQDVSEASIQLGP